MELSEIIKQEEQKIGYVHGQSDIEKIAYLFQRYREQNEKLLKNMQDFREDTRVWLRAITTILETVLYGATHREKDSRIRGLIAYLEARNNDLIENWIEHSGYWRRVDWWHSVHQDREYVRQLQAKSCEVEALKREIEHQRTDIDGLVKVNIELKMELGELKGEATKDTV